MSILVKGTDFGPTEQVTSTKLDNLVDAASFTNTSETAVSYTGSTGTCLQGGGLEVTSAGQLQVKDGEITTAKIANSSSKTTGVTFEKMQHISTSKILGRTTAGEGDVEEVSLLDEDNMSSDSATAVATQQSIKAYVDSEVDTYALKYSGSTGTFNSSSSYTDLNLSSVVGSNRAMVILEISGPTVSSDDLFFRTKGSSIEPYTPTNKAGWGSSGVTISNGIGGTIVLTTDTSGIIQHRTQGNSLTGISYTLQAYQVLK